MGKNSNAIRVALYAKRFGDLAGFLGWCMEEGWHNIPYEVGYVNDRNIFGQFVIPDRYFMPGDGGVGLLNMDFGVVKKDLEGSAILHVMMHNGYDNIRLVTDGDFLYVCLVHSGGGGGDLLSPSVALLNLRYDVKWILPKLSFVQGRVLMEALSMMLA